VNDQPAPAGPSVGVVPPTPQGRRHPLTGRVLAAYLVLCIVWGATFLAIRVGVQHLPPALFAGARFLTAGVVLLLVTAVLKRPMPRGTADWARTVLVGTLLLVSGNGLVVWGAQYVPSGKTAVVMVTGPLWMALFDGLIPGAASRPGWSQIGGLLVGFSGALLLVGGDAATLRQADWRGPAAMFLASMSWAFGSVYWKRHPIAVSPYITAALHMTIGGALLTAIGLLAGEGGRWQFSVPGVGAVLYLIVFGSVVGYSCYVYVLKHTTLTLTSTYVYVNTVVAVILGWAVLGEEITGRTVMAMVAVLGSVLWVQRRARI